MNESRRSKLASHTEQQLGDEMIRDNYRDNVVTFPLNDDVSVLMKAHANLRRNWDHFESK